MADRLGVSTSGFYEWRDRQQSPCQRRTADAGLAEAIVEIWRQSRGTYGSPRIWAELRLGMNIRVGRKRVARLMRQQGIEGVYRRRSRGCTRRNPSAVPDEDLVNRQFSVDGPDRLWIADIERHEAFWNRAVVKGHRSWSVVAGPGEAGGSLNRGTPGRVDSSPDKAGTCQHCQWCGSGE
jgi:hypothetical protein